MENLIIGTNSQGQKVYLSVYENKTVYGACVVTIYDNTNGYNIILNKIQQKALINMLIEAL